jgi:outer membrane protein TolC
MQIDLRERLARLESLLATADHVAARLLPAGERLVELHLAALREGDVDLLAALQAQRQALRARSAALDGDSELAAALADLERAAGVPWESLVRPCAR